MVVSVSWITFPITALPVFFLFFIPYSTNESNTLFCQLYSTANTYHFYHSLALLGASRCRRPALVSVYARQMKVELVD